MSDFIQEKRLFRVNNSGRVRVRHSSHKLNGDGYCESMFESSVYFALDLDHNIVEYRPQPVSFEFYKTDGSAKTQRYTPDTLVSHANNKKEFLEIKPSEKVTDDLIADIANFNRQLVARGCPTVRLVTDKDYSNTLRKNAKTIMHFHKIKRDKILSSLMSIDVHKIRYFGELKQQLDKVHNCYALGALAHQFATINLNAPLSDDSYLSWTGGRQ